MTGEQSAREDSADPSCRDITSEHRTREDSADPSCRDITSEHRIREDSADPSCRDITSEHSADPSCRDITASRNDQVQEEPTPDAQTHHELEESTASVYCEVNHEARLRRSRASSAILQNEAHRVVEMLRTVTSGSLEGDGEVSNALVLSPLLRPSTTSDDEGDEFINSSEETQRSYEYAHSLFNRLKDTPVLNLYSLRNARRGSASSPNSTRTLNLDEAFILESSGAAGDASQQQSTPELHLLLPMAHQQDSDPVGEHQQETAQGSGGQQLTQGSAQGSGGQQLTQGSTPQSALASVQRSVEASLVVESTAGGSLAHRTANVISDDDETAYEHLALSMRQSSHAVEDMLGEERGVGMSLNVVRDMVLRSLQRSDMVPTAPLASSDSSSDSSPGAEQFGIPQRLLHQQQQQQPNEPGTAHEDDPFVPPHPPGTPPTVEFPEHLMDPSQGDLVRRRHQPYGSAYSVYCESFCDCPKTSRDMVCSCGEDQQEELEWVWDENASSYAIELSDQQRTAFFHIHYSSGTAATRGTQPFTDKQYFWEVKMTSPVYGTDMMVGIATETVRLDGHRNSFVSLLGRDADSWGLSYYGRIQHKAAFSQLKTAKFGQGTIIGVHVDMWYGTLTFFKNRRCIGQVRHGLNGKVVYPVVTSTAARTSMKVITACSFPTSLQYLCCQALRKYIPCDQHVVNSVKPMPPGLRAFLENNLGWLLRPSNIPSRPTQVHVTRKRKRVTADSEKDEPRGSKKLCQH